MADLTGHKFHNWTVLEEADSLNNKKRWLCQCVCGRKKVLYQYVISHGRSRSCGCKRGYDLTGKQFGNLKVLMRAIRGDQVRGWVCECSCGKLTLVRTQSLVEGYTQSCGCAGMKKPQKNPETKLFQYYKRTAKKNGENFKLTKTEFLDIVGEPCYFCGVEPTAGVNALDPSLGYVVDNVVSCCGDCRVAKNSKTLKDFTGWLQRIYKHLS